MKITTQCLVLVRPHTIPVLDPSQEKYGQRLQEKAVRNYQKSKKHEIKTRKKKDLELFSLEKFKLKGNFIHLQIVKKCCDKNV